jgi:hypothetical protein
MTGRPGDLGRPWTGGKRKNSPKATETGLAAVLVDMGAVSSEDDGFVTAAAEMLRRERPTPTFDELQRVDRRLTAFRVSAQRGPVRRGWSRLAMMACLSVGLLFTTAGSGLALSGYAASGPAVHAQYPDSTPRRLTPPTTKGVPARPHAGSHASPSSVGRLKKTGGSTSYVSLVHAETDNELPFTGFAAIPVLLAGIALIATGAVIHRRTRAS